MRGSLKTAKEARQEARDTLDAAKATIQELRNADFVDQGALNRAIQEKQATKNALIQARTQVQIVRGQKILEKYNASPSAEQVNAYNALTTAATEAAGIAEQIAALDVTDPNDLNTAIELKKQLDEVSKTKVRLAINKGKLQNMNAIAEGVRTIIAEAGATEALQSDCGAALSSFNSAASAPGAATTGWSTTKAAFTTAIACARTVASEFEDYTPGSSCDGGITVAGGRCAPWSEVSEYITPCDPGAATGIGVSVPSASGGTVCVLVGGSSSTLQNPYFESFVNTVSGPVLNQRSRLGTSLNVPAQTVIPPTSECPVFRRIGIGLGAPTVCLDQYEWAYLNYALSGEVLFDAGY